MKRLKIVPFLLIILFLFFSQKLPAVSKDYIPVYVRTNFDSALARYKWSVLNQKKIAADYKTLTEKFLSQNSDSTKLCEYYRITGLYFINLGEYGKAAEYLIKSVNLAEKLNDTDRKNSALNNLAVLNLKTKNYEKGIKIFEELKKDSESRGDSAEALQYSLNLALAYGEAGNYKKAKNSLIEIYKKKGKNNFINAVVTNSLAFIYNRTGNFKKAEYFALQSINLSEKLNDVGLKVNCLTNYSNALRGLGKYEKSLKILREIVRLAKENRLTRALNDATGNLALLYEKTGNYKKAYYYYKKFSQQKDSLLNSEMTQKINDLQIKYETELKDKEIERQKAELKRKNRFLVLTTAGIFVLLFLSAVIFILYRKKNEAYEELVKKNLILLNNDRSDLIFKEKITDENTRKSKYESSSLTDEKKDEISSKIKKLMHEEKIFLSQDFSLTKLSERLGINPKYVSQVIHEIFSLNFSDYVNRERVFEAAKLLSSAEYSHFTIEGIAETVGFKTKSSFNAYFKKYLGVTPSFFRKTSGKILPVKNKAV